MATKFKSLNQLKSKKSLRKSLTKHTYSDRIKPMKTEQERFDFIKQAVATASKKVPAEFKGLVAELKAEKLAEELILEHGVSEASEEDILDECESLDSFDSDSGEDEDFENDENLTDMEAVSGAMLDIFGE